MLQIKPVILLLLIAGVVVSCSGTIEKPVSDYVDPFIGTGGIVHTFPGATFPFGMIQLSPDTDTRGWNWCSGYHYSDSSLLGFSHTHLSGTGWADLGDILMMATAGEPVLEPGSKENPESGYRSSFSHDSEEARPGYYRVLLEDYDIVAEMTATERTGWHRYSFGRGGRGNIIIDPLSKIFGTTVLGKVEFPNDTTVTGFSKSTGWGGERTTWFCASFSEPFDSFGTGDGNRGWVSYENSDGLVLEIKVAISLVGADGAVKNLQSDPSGSFDEACSYSAGKWEEALSSIIIEAPGEEQLTLFYTSLYHTMIHPSLNSDADGRYYSGGNIYTASGFNGYSSFSLWDTFRAVHPLFTIINTGHTADFVRSLVSRYENGDQLPIWELCGYDNRCMIGYPSVAVIADAIIKDIEGIDEQKAYDAMRSIAYHPKITDTGLPGGLEKYLEYGYVTADIPQSVSKTMEFAYYDWCIARVAEKLGLEEDAGLFYGRSRSFMKHWYPEKGLFWPRRADGTWVEELSLTNWEELKQHYISGNIWAYSLFFPHATGDFIDTIGGEEAFGEMLEKLFETRLIMEGEQHVDISGFIGQYGHGDEPGHHIPYLYNYTRSPWKTAERVRQVTKNWYSTGIDGMPNNDDCGQMSAWYIFSALGFYPVTPADTIYLFGSPSVSSAQVRLPGGRVFIIETENLSDNNIYIESVVLNGKEKRQNYITHSEIMNGGDLVFRMGPEPNRSWGVEKEERPVSQIRQNINNK